MADLTKNTEREYIRTGTGFVIHYKVEAAKHIYIGMAVSLDGGANYGVVPASDAADQLFLGIAKSEADNSGGAYGDLTVEVELYGRVWISNTNQSQEDEQNKDIHFDDSDGDNLGSGAGALTTRIDGRIIDVVVDEKVLVDLSHHT